jgi:hypothetical protein
VARGVRIPRRDGPGRGGPPAESSSEPSGAVHPNSAAERRARRLFTVFVGGVAFTYALFVGLAATSPAPGVRDSAAPYVLFSLLAAALLAIGWQLTLGRTPRAAWIDFDGHLVVKERSGRLRHFPVEPGLDLRIVGTQGASVLGEPVDVAELRAARGPPRRYVVAREFFGFVATPRTA